MLDTVEMIDSMNPISSNWSLGVTRMSVLRGSCGGALLPDGINTLIVGGTQGGLSVHNTSEIFNTETGVFRSGPVSSPGHVLGMLLSSTREGLG